MPVFKNVILFLAKETQQHPPPPRRHPCLESDGDALTAAGACEPSVAVTPFGTLSDWAWSRNTVQRLRSHSFRDRFEEFRNVSIKGYLGRLAYNGKPRRNGLGRKAAEVAGGLVRPGGEGPERLRTQFLFRPVPSRCSTEFSTRLNFSFIAVSAITLI